MNVQEAKDFLVEQATQQASLDGVSLSDLEKRMMYFTESADAVENPITLNEEFEEKYDMEEYEAKVGGLLRRAYARLQRENAPNVERWKESVRFLQKGDHYILVLCGVLMPVGGSPIASFGVSGTAWWIGAVGLAALVGFFALRHYLNSGTPWIGRSLLIIFVSSYVYFGGLPMFFKRLPMPWSKFSGARQTQEK